MGVFEQLVQQSTDVAKTLNSYLASRTFISGRSFSAEDTAALANPDVARAAQQHHSFPHLTRWIRHCRSLGEGTHTTGSHDDVAHGQQKVLARLERVRRIASQCEELLSKRGLALPQTPAEWRAELGHNHELANHCEAAGLRLIAFKRVPGNYYDRPLEARKDLVGAASINHLCKTIVMENCKWSKEDASPTNPQFVCVVLQYTTRLNADAVKKAIAEANPSVSKSKFNFQLAQEADSDRLTGYRHNAVVPIGMKTDLPILLSDQITRLNPAHFWLGAGQVDVKLRVDLKEFCEQLKPKVVCVVQR